MMELNDRQVASLLKKLRITEEQLSRALDCVGPDPIRLELYILRREKPELDFFEPAKSKSLKIAAMPISEDPMEFYEGGKDDPEQLYSA